MNLYFHTHVPKPPINTPHIGDHIQCVRRSFVCKAARAVEEAKVLIEDGFSYVCEFDGFGLFRKR